MKKERNIIQGKLVIITGSGMGLGKAFATKLLEAGAMVCISDLDEATGVHFFKNYIAMVFFHILHSYTVI